MGDFGLGDGLEGLIDPRTGAVAIDVALAGVGLHWSSASTGVDRVGFGEGWSLTGVGHVEIEGGRRLVTSSGAVHEVDGSTRSGLYGYVLGDLEFTAEQGELPARDDGLVGARAYAFRLDELGGRSSYFDAAGDAIATLDARGNRQDWVWSDERPRRLLRTVTEPGVATVLDWADDSTVTFTTSAGEGAPASTASVELGPEGVVAVVDPVGRRVDVVYGRDGLLSSVTGASGASTRFSWQRPGDGTVAVDHVAVVDSVTGAELSARSWTASTGSRAGWPSIQTPLASGIESVGAGYETVLSDGSSDVRSEYDGRHRLVARSLVATTAAGERMLRQQRFGYPDPARGGGDLAASFTRPERQTVTYHDGNGATRSATERYEFDEFGRQTARVAADGTFTLTQYDAGAGGDVPVGLPVLERVTAPDGLVSETRWQLDDLGSAVAAIESFSGRASADDSDVTAPLVRTARTEFEVADDGFVEVERAFPQGGSGTPLVTEHTRTVDRAAGTATLTETVAAGTALASTTTAVTDLVHGQPLESVDAFGRRSTAEYDSAGRPTSVIDAAGRTTTTAYLTMRDDGANATVVTAPTEVAGGSGGDEQRAALVTTEHRDALDRVVRVTDNIDHGTPRAGHVRVAESRAYPDAATVEITDAWGATTTARQDVFGRPVVATAASGLTKVIEYDDVANTQSSGLTPTGSLDDAETVAIERVDSETGTTHSNGVRADGIAVPETVATTDGFGRMVRSSGVAAASTVEFDPYGNPTTTTTTATMPTTHPPADGAAGAGADRLIESRTFDAYGASVEKTVTDGETERSGGVRELDVLGRTVTETDQAGRETGYAYTPDGLVAEVVTSDGGRTVNRYDDETRALIETVTAGPVGATVRTAFELDPMTDEVLAVFDPADRDGTEIVFEYDAWGNTSSIGYPDGRFVRHDYDEHGRRVATTDVTGNVTRLAYTEAGALASAVQTDETGDELGRVAYDDDEHGRLVRLSRGNGVVTEYAYTSASEISSERTTGADGRLISARSYAYADTGDLASRTDTIPADAHEAEDAPVVTTTTYEYDAHRRLVASSRHRGASEGAPTSERTDYVLTASGDVARETITSEPGADAERVTTRAFAYGPTGELASIRTTDAEGVTDTAELVYDSAGNLTRAADGTRYDYDARNQRVRETTPDGEVIETAYWASGQRASLTAAPTATGDERGVERTTTFYWDDTTLVNEAHAADARAPEQIASYLLGANRHARSIEGLHTGTSYYTHDRHGNVTELTNAAGLATDRYEYRDYGVESATAHVAPEVGAAPAGQRTGEITRNPFRYAGEHTDPSGDQYLQERTYLPEIMRFAEKDRANLHNVYWFGDANPVMHVDPTGRTASPDTIINSVFTSFGLAAGAISIALAAFSGGAALGPLGMIWTGIGVTADAWALQLGIGGLLSEHAPEIVDDTFEAFYRSETVQWSGTVLGVGIVVAGELLVDAGIMLSRASRGLPNPKGPDPLPSSWRADFSWLHKKMYAAIDGVPSPNDYYTMKRPSGSHVATLDFGDMPGDFQVLAIDVQRYDRGLPFMINAEGPSTFAGNQELLEWAIANGYKGLVAKAPPAMSGKPGNPVTPRDTFLDRGQFEAWREAQRYGGGEASGSGSIWTFRFLTQEAVTEAMTSRMLRYW